MKRPTDRRKRLNGGQTRTAATAPKRKASIARPHLELAVLVGTRKCALIYQENFCLRVKRLPF